MRDIWAVLLTMFIVLVVATIIAVIVGLYLLPFLMAKYSFAVALIVILAIIYLTGIGLAALSIALLERL